MSNMTRLRTNPHRRFAPIIAFALCVLSAYAEAPPPISGDVNADGLIDILDIQGATNIALGSADTNAQADVDDFTGVNILDVQVLTNTALGVGGLVQPVAGTLFSGKNLKATGDITCVALSTDGRKVEVPVDPVSGYFQMSLPVHTTWSLSFFTELPDGSTTVGTVSFPLGEGAVSSLPLPGLSTGNLIDIGQVSAGIEAPTEDDLRTLLAEGGEPLNTGDADQNGFIDVFQGLFQPYPWEVEGSSINVPGDLDEANLEREVAECMEEYIEIIALPDLTGVEIGGVPAFAAPILTCFTVELTEWLNDSEANLNPLQIATLIFKISAALEPRIGPWLASLDRDELTDLDDNGIPDYIEGELCGTGNKGVSCELDLDGNGVPDYAEDTDGDGISNLFDEDSYSGADSDGDSIPNATDLDDDNDGVLDYADASPLDPKVS